MGAGGKKGELLIAAPMNENWEERGGKKGKQLSPISPSLLPFESQSHLPKLTKSKKKKGGGGKKTGETSFLHLQICYVGLCNFLKSSVSKTLCLQSGVKRFCPLESVFKTSYEKRLVVCLIFTSAAVLLNLFLPGESVLYKIS